ncbi:MAG: ATP-binding protein [Myxococcales bacterium]|nr:ATP-binding protein [Myxococcales bacterium]
MSTETEHREAWLDANHRHLLAAIERVGTLLEQHLGRTQRRVPPPGRALGSQGAGEPGGHDAAPLDPSLPPPALAVLGSAFSLTPFERDLLVLCAGVELDADLHACCAAAQGNAGRAAPTFGLALAALPDGHWSALAPQGALRRGCLIAVQPGENLTTSPLRIEERVLHFLTGLSGEAARDARLCSLFSPHGASARLAPSQAALSRRIARHVAEGKQRDLQVAISGAEATDRSAVAAAVCAELGLELLTLRAGDVPTSAAERDLLARQWQREVLLERCALILAIDESEDPSGEALRAVLAFCERLPGVVLLSSRDPLRGPQSARLRFELNRLNREEQSALWQVPLESGRTALRSPEHLESVLAHFRLGTSAIATAAEHAAAQALSDRPEDAAQGDVADIGPHLWDACRLLARPQLDALAQRIDSEAGFADLVLPESQQQILRAIVAQLRHQFIVHHRWGFARSSRGRGISALFVGPSGTGKTLAAEVLANELRLDLYRVDLSQVVSKYIGETEKNLRRVFDAAEQGGAVLLFDEADALFGKRSEVKDSHDRYANIEVSYLLQRMEAYQGVSILTTNLRAALDTAFLRRIRFVVNFPFPSASQRAEIWRRAIPPTAPSEGLDFEKLSRLSVSGGHIANIALGAAFAAAAAGEPLRMSHFQQAARLECAKIENVTGEHEIGGWV